MSDACCIIEIHCKPLQCVLTPLIDSTFPAMRCVDGHDVKSFHVVLCVKQHCVKSFD